jgi:hypothetical protein
MKKSAILLLISFFTIGCARTKRINDNYQYQPIVNSNIAAKAIVEVVPQGLADIGTTIYDTRLKWISYAEKNKFSDEIIKACEHFMLNHDHIIKSVKINSNLLPNNPEYPWLRYENALYFDTIVIADVPFEERHLLAEKHYYSAGGEKIGYIKRIRDDGYLVIKTIVSLNPVVVVISDGVILKFNKTLTYDAAVDYIIEGKGSTDVLYENVVLKNGYAYGTRIPYAESPQWFSPDMNIPPTPVEFDDEGIGHIPVPWGELIMTREGDDWVVSAKTK